MTDFNAETEQRGLLLGDGTIRSAKRQFLRGLTAPLATVSNDIALLSQIGIRVTNDRVTFSRTDFEAALAENPEGVQALFTARRPLSEDVQLDDFNDGRGVRAVSGSDFKVTLRDGTEIEVDVTGADSADDIVNLINSAGSSFGLTASLDSSRNRYVLTDSTTGTESFRVSALNSSSVANDLGLNRSADVDGGGTLSGFEIDLTGDVGVMSRFDDTLEALVNPDGVLQRRADGLDQRIVDIEERIEALEERVLRREDFLRRQFANLEQSLSQSQNTLAQLTAQLGSLGG